MTGTTIDQEVDSLPSKNNGARAGIELARDLFYGYMRGAKSNKFNKLREIHFFQFPLDPLKPRGISHTMVTSYVSAYTLDTAFYDHFTH